MVGEDVLARYRVVNHTAHDPATMRRGGALARTARPSS